MIPPGLDANALDALCMRLDGLLLTGGADLDPALYGEQRMPESGDVEPERDELELAMTRTALARDLPILGICRGMQALNVACGGTLYQDIATQLPDTELHDWHKLPRNHLAHNVTVEPGSRLSEILGAQELRVNSLHHQAVRRPGAGLRIVARAADGVAEGLEAPGRRFALAVQYHPEELVETDALSRRLFDAFTQACRER
jgi:putative glutamine amidotransferase